MNDLKISLQGRIEKIKETTIKSTKKVDEKNNPIDIKIKPIVIKIEDDQSYEHEFEVNFYNKKTEQLEDVNEGDTVAVFGYLKDNQYVSKEGEKKYYISITGNSIKKI